MWRNGARATIAWISSRNCASIGAAKRRSNAPPGASATVSTAGAAADGASTFVGSPASISGADASLTSPSEAGGFASRLPTPRADRASAGPFTRPPRSCTAPGCAAARADRSPGNRGRRRAAGCRRRAERRCRPAVVGERAERRIGEHDAVDAWVVGRAADHVVARPLDVEGAGRRREGALHRRAAVLGQVVGEDRVVDRKVQRARRPPRRNSRRPPSSDCSRTSRCGSTLAPSSLASIERAADALRRLVAGERAVDDLEPAPPSICAAPNVTRRIVGERRRHDVERRRFEVNSAPACARGCRGTARGRSSSGAAAPLACDRCARRARCALVADETRAADQQVGVVAAVDPDRARVAAGTALARVADAGAAGGRAVWTLPPCRSRRCPRTRC